MGFRPVIRLACAGSVVGAAATARSKSTPSLASRSRVGVRAAEAPYAPTWSARVVSSVTSNTFGGPAGASVAPPPHNHQAPADTTASAATTTATHTGRDPSDGGAVGTAGLSA